MAPGYSRIYKDDLHTKTFYEYYEWFVDESYK